MTTELWIALLTFLTACVGGGRWLIYIYWQQARQIAQLQKTNQAQFALRVEGAITDHKRMLEAHQKELIDVSDRLLKIQAIAAKTSEANANNAKLLNDYIETTANRFQKLETQFVALSKNLIMVKGSSGQRNS